MKKIIFLFSGIIILLLYTGCNKNFQNETIDNLHTVKPDKKMNRLTLSEEQIFKLYHQFHNKYNNFKFKNLDTSNLQADTAIWQFETCINTDYGFPFEVSHKVYDIYDTLEFSITGYTTDSIPVINGYELYTAYNNKVIEIQNENNNGDSTYFWCINMNIYDVDKNRNMLLIASMLSYATPYPHILPPGVYPDPFPDPTCYDAVNPINGDNAAKMFEQKYEIQGPPGPSGTGQYVITLYQLMGYDHNSPNVGEKLWWHYYSSENLCTSPTGDGRLNNYLFSTKDVIDEHNYSHDNIFLGNLNIYPFYLPGNYHQWEHIVEMYFYYIHYEAYQD